MKMKIWKKWLVLGVVSVLFGLFVLANPIAASVTVTIVAGITFGLMGVAQIYAGAVSQEGMSKVMGVGLGVLLVLMGLSFTIHPLQGLISLATIATILIGANGVMRLITSFQMRQTVMFWPMLFSGAFSVLLAGYILANFSEIAPQLLGILLGVELLFNGIGLVALAIFLRTAKGVIKDKLEERMNK